MLRRRHLAGMLGSMVLVLPVLLAAQGDVSQGEQLYSLKCGRCHMAYPPQRYSVEEWKTVLKEMGPISGLRQETEQEILAYLEENAEGRESGGLPTDPVLGGYLYTEFFTSPASTDTFDIHYLNVNLAGRVHSLVSYRAEFEFEHGGGEAEPPFIEQAYMDVWFRPNAALRIGAILAPFNRFDDFHAPLENWLVTRPQVSREIAVSAWKDVGINLHGNLIVNPDVYLNYDLYLINGLGAGSRLRNSRHYRDNNDAKSLGFRLSGVLWDQWELGGSFYHGAWDDEGRHVLNMYGAHFLGKTGDLSLYAEFAKSLSGNPDPFETGKGDGYFIQGSYLIRDRFRPTMRFGSLDYLDLSDQLGRRPTDFDRRILALGFNYYLTSSIVFKAEYDIYFPGDRETDNNKDMLALQAAVRF